MFETTTVESREHHTRAASIGALPLAIGLHLVVLGAYLMAQLWEQTLPLWPPGMMTSYVVLDVVVPPPPPPSPAAQPEIPPDGFPENAAPTMVPDTIPVLEEAPPEPLVFASVIGDVGGVEGWLGGGEVGGVIGGLLSGVITSAPPVDTVVIRRDADLPVRPISMPFPYYPEKYRLKQVEDDVVLRYTINKEGQVSDVVIIVPSNFREFDEASVTAISSWRFAPLVINGERKRIVHELTIHYRIHQKEQRRRIEARKEERKRARDQSGLR